MRLTDNCEEKTTQLCLTMVAVAHDCVVQVVNFANMTWEEKTGPATSGDIPATTYDRRTSADIPVADDVLLSYVVATTTPALVADDVLLSYVVATTTCSRC